MNQFSVGEIVATPEGFGRITRVFTSEVSVELKGGQNVIFTSNEVSPVPEMAVKG